MKSKALALVALVAAVAAPSIAHACEFLSNISFVGIPSRATIGVGVLTPSDDIFASMVLSGSVGLGLGKRLALVPTIGLCTEDGGEGGEDFSEVMFGGAAAFQLFASSDNKFKLNLQSGVSILSTDGATETNIPIQAAGQYSVSENAALYFGGGLVMSKFSSDFFDESDSDPVLFGGLSLMIKKLMLSAGLGAKVGDEDTDIAIGVGLKIPLGGS